MIGSDCMLTGSDCMLTDSDCMLTGSDCMLTGLFGAVLDRATRSCRAEWTYP